MRMTPSNVTEAWSFAHGIAVALNWADYRCECGAGRWSVFTAHWVMCDVCEVSISVAEVAEAADPDAVVALSVVRMPGSGRL